LSGSSPIRSYAYAYDALNRLKEADYKASADGLLWDKEVGYFNESITGYDANGNILGIERRGLRNLGKLAQPEPSDFGLIDQLSYTYSSQNPNQLVKVNDAITASIGNGIDFKDGASSPQEYTYDANGNLSADANKNIESIAYNHLNLPTKILFTGNREITFLYDAAGVKLRKTVKEPNASEQVTDYLGGFVYENEELAFFPHAEGRWLRPLAPEGGTAFVAEYQYKDHLGNLRLSFRGQAAEVFEATMEENAQTNGQPEEVVFDFIEQTRDNSQKRTGASSAKLSPEQPIGMWKSLPLRRGDKVKAEVYGKYVSTPSNNNVNILPFINPLPATMPAAEGNNNPAWLSAGLVISPVSQNNTGVPKSYLRGQFFDTSGNFLRAVSVSLSEGGAWQELSFDFEAEIEGTLQVFVGSESDVSVWYDDLQITWEHALIVQENHYYPFGMNLVGIEKQGQPHDRFQYNGKEKQEEFGLNAYDYGARLYSFDAPRWWQVDELAEKYHSLSPYNYVANNPIIFIDPDGREIYTYTGEEAVAVFKQIQAQVAGQGQEGQEDCCPDMLERIMGLGQILAGVGEWALAGTLAVTPEPTMLTKLAAGGLALHGADNLSTGWYRLANGLPQRTLTAQAISTAVSPLVKDEALATEIGDFGDATFGLLGAGAFGLSRTSNYFGKTLSAGGNATKGGFSVNPSKFDYFFGRVVSGSEHNIARSAQNLRDLTTLGIKSESQLMNVFGQALESGAVISAKTSQYGTTVMRSVNIGNQGSINVGFFYQGGNMSATPSVSTIIPKIFK
jgi:RHS repeat-associated protein